ncbi:MAG: hypothetical protein P4M02_07455 [Clostridia bacterium]|nr:hypothetical protein [Clostridia bacterium]
MMRGFFGGNCEWIIILVLILFCCCGNGFGFGSGCEHECGNGC